MKRAILFFLLLSPLAAFSCERDSTRHWSFGAILLSESYYAETGAGLHAFPGLVIRKDLGAFRLRGGLELFYDSQNQFFTPSYPDQLYTKGREWELLVRAGLEKGWTLSSHFQPYVALDLGSLFARSDYTDEGGIAGLYERRISTHNGAGILPAAGIEFLFSDHFSLSFETQYSVMYATRTEQTIYYLGNIDSRPVTEKGWETGFNRLGGVALHFRL